MRSKCSRVHSSHDLCAHAHVHSLEGTLFTNQSHIYDSTEDCRTFPKKWRWPKWTPPFTPHLKYKSRTIQVNSQWSQKMFNLEKHSEDGTVVLLPEDSLTFEPHDLIINLVLFKGLIWSTICMGSWTKSQLCISIDTVKLMACANGTTSINSCHPLESGSIGGQHRLTCHMALHILMWTCQNVCQHNLSPSSKNQIHLSPFQLNFYFTRTKRIWVDLSYSLATCVT